MGAKWVGVLTVAVGVLAPGLAGAQLGAEVPESALREPWVQQLAVLQSLSGTITATSDAQERARLAEQLTYLQVAIGEYEAQVDRLIDRIAGDPQFPYVAAETSAALGTKLSEIHARFDTLYASLRVQQRADVRAAQASLDALRSLLQAKVHFERDVLNVFAVLSRQRIAELATRWWNGEERAIALKQLVAELRLKLESR
jgi:hypothetical protein